MMTFVDWVGGLVLSGLRRSRRSVRVPKEQFHDASSAAEGLSRRALVMMREKDFGHAEQVYETLAADAPDFAEGVQAYGELLDILGRRKEAAAKYTEARRLVAARRTGSPDRRFVFRHSGNFDPEIVAYTNIIDHRAKSALPWLARGNAYLANGHAQEALRDYERALRLAPSSLDVVALKAEALSLLGRYRDALQEFDRVLQGQPLDAETLNARGIAHMALGDVEKAQRDWHQQFECLRAEQYLARACVALRLADYEAAIPELQKAIVRQPHELYWPLYLRMACRRAGKKADAVAEVAGASWPQPLIAWYDGKLSESDVRQKADTPARLAEVALHLAPVAAERGASEVQEALRAAIRSMSPSSIEFCAASSEIGRLALGSRD